MQDLTQGILSEFAERQRLAPLRALAKGLVFTRKTHTDTKLILQNEWRAKRRLSGACVTCGSAPLFTKHLCKVCRDKLNADRRASRAKCQ